MHNKKIILCLDGTWNNTYAEALRTDGSKLIKPSNVLKVARALKPQTKNGCTQLVHYDSGVGALAAYEGWPNKLLHLTDKYLGGIFGAGFEANIEAAITFLVNNYNVKDEVYIFGFSRGAATARALTNFIDWLGGLPTKRDAFYIPKLLRFYMKHKSEKSSKVQIEIINHELSHNGANQILENFTPFNVKFMGLWDTVLALKFGSCNSNSNNLSNKNSTDANADANADADANMLTTDNPSIKVRGKHYHIGIAPAKCVTNANHALATDEARSDFYPEIWQKIHPHQTVKQYWFAGVHSNIGGGYANDGLANVALKWVLDDAKYHGLEFDQGYLRYFRSYYQDALVNSKTSQYKIFDMLRMTSGERLIQTNNCTEPNIHYSVIKRICAKPSSKHPLLNTYRPQNIKKYFGKYTADQLAKILNTLSERDYKKPALEHEIERFSRFVFG